MLTNFLYQIQPIFVIELAIIFFFAPTVVSEDVDWHSAIDVTASEHPIIFLFLLNDQYNSLSKIYIIFFKFLPLYLFYFSYLYKEVNNHNNNIIISRKGIYWWITKTFRALKNSGFSKKIFTRRLAYILILKTKLMRKSFFYFIILTCLYYCFLVVCDG